MGRSVLGPRTSRPPFPRLLYRSAALQKPWKLNKCLTDSFIDEFADEQSHAFAGGEAERTACCSVRCEARRAPAVQYTRVADLEASFSADGSQHSGGRQAFSDFGKDTQFL